MRKKLFVGLALLIVSLLILPGCITFNFNTTINPNGSGKRSLDIAIDEGFATLLEASTEREGKKTIEEGIKDSLPKGAKFKAYTKEGKKHYEASFEFKNIAELKETNKKMSKSGQGLNIGDIELTKKDLFFIATYTFSEKFAGAGKGQSKQVEQLTQAFSINYNLTMPGKITKANTDEVKEDTATWHINTAKGGEVKATSRYIRWWAIILAALIIIGVILAIAIVILASRRKKTEPAQEKT